MILCFLHDLKSSPCAVFSWTQSVHYVLHYMSLYCFQGQFYVTAWGNCPKPLLCPQMRHETLLMNSKHRHIPIGPNRSIVWPSKYAKMPGPCCGSSWGSLKPSSPLGRGHPSLCFTPLGAFGAVNFPTFSTPHSAPEYWGTLPRNIFSLLSAWLLLHGS